MVAYLLLYDRSDMGVGGVLCQWKYGPIPGKGWARGLKAIRAVMAAGNILLGNGDLILSLDQID